MSPVNENELQFRVGIEPVVSSMLDSLEKDSETLGLAPDLFQRAVWTWAMSKLLATNKEPAWFIPELNRLQQESAG